MDSDAIKNALSAAYSGGLADVVRDLGQVCCSTNEALQDVISRFEDVSEVDVARLLGMMITRPKTSPDSLLSTQMLSGLRVKLSAQNVTGHWDVGVLASVLRESVPSHLYIRFALREKMIV